MRQRCGNPAHKHYPLYGGRGIQVCAQWQAFLGFYRWAQASGYHPGLTIDRINNDGNYEPGNCRWVTQLIQCNNSRLCRMVLYHGRTQNLAMWAGELGLNYHTLRSRLRIGWPVERAFETPMERQYSHGHSG
jgi:hypothetical protein